MRSGRRQAASDFTAVIQGSAQPSLFGAIKTGLWAAVSPQAAVSRQAKFKSDTKVFNIVYRMR